MSDALLDAFPTRADLEQMVLLGLNTSLERIAGSGNLTHQVRELIVWAQAQGRLEELVANANEANRSNPTLKKLAIDFEGWRSPAPAPEPAPSTSGVNMAALRTVIGDAFSSDELQTLCADIEQILKDAGVNLTVNLETVGGSSKPVVVLNLIQYLQRRGRLPALLQAVRAARPGLV